MISETKKYIRLAEAKLDIEHGLEAAFEQALQMPILRGGKNRFWLISNPGSRADNWPDYIDTVSLVDAGAFGNIARGSVPDHLDHNYELYPEENRQAAFRDAYDRWMNK